jgi:hypothetical protein
VSVGVEIMLQMSDKTSTCLANTLTRAADTLCQPLIHKIDTIIKRGRNVSFGPFAFIG